MHRPHCFSFQGHGRSINDLRFLPSDPNMLLSCSSDESCRLWNVVTSQLAVIFGGWHGHRSAVLSLDVHVMGRMFASCGMDNRCLSLNPNLTSCRFACTSIQCCSSLPSCPQHPSMVAQQRRCAAGDTINTRIVCDRTPHAPPPLHFRPWKALTSTSKKRCTFHQPSSSSSSSSTVTDVLQRQQFQSWPRPNLH